jgi:hypothetical protein
MKNINKFIDLLIINICIVSIQSYDNGSFIHDDNDINEVLSKSVIENYYHRVRRDNGNGTTIAFDGSGDASSENI